MAWTAIFSIESEGNKKSTFQVNLDGSLAFNTVTLAVQGLAFVVDKIIGGVIRSVSLSNQVDLTAVGLRTTPDANTDVEEGASLQFITDGNHYTGFRIPTLEEAFLSAEGELDTTDPEVADVIGAILGTYDLDPDAGVVQNVFVDSRDEDIVSLVWARETFLSNRGSRR